MQQHTYRNGLIPLMDEIETSHCAVQSVLRAATREEYESKTGRLEYSIGNYERLIRATSNQGCIDDESKFYLLLSFDLKSAVIDDIEEKVVPFIEKNKGKYG